MKFKVTEQYGHYIYIMPSQYSDKAVQEAKDLLMDISIEPFVPEKYLDKITWIVMAPNPKDFGRFRYGTVAWKIGPIRKKQVVR